MFPKCMCFLFNAYEFQPICMFLVCVYVLRLAYLYNAYQCVFMLLVLGRMPQKTFLYSDKKYNFISAGRMFCPELDRSDLLKLNPAAHIHTGVLSFPCLDVDLLHNVRQKKLYISVSNNREETSLRNV